MLTGKFDVQDIEDLGRHHELCPWFLSRQHVESASIIVCPHTYLCDPLTFTLLTTRMRKKLLLVVDEAHNLIPTIKSCCDMSMTLEDLQQVSTEIAELKTHMDDHKLNDLESEETEHFKAEFFVFRKLKEYCHKLRTVGDVETIREDIHKLSEELVSAKDKMDSILRAVKQVHDEHWEKTFSFVRLVSLVAQMQSDVSLNYSDEQILELKVTDTAVCMNLLYKSFAHTILMSGTLQPMELSMIQLHMQKAVTVSLPFSFVPEQMKMVHIPEIDGQTLNTSTSEKVNKPRYKTDTMTAFGVLATKLAQLTPGGMLIFFQCTETLLLYSQYWKDMAIWGRMNEAKPIFTAIFSDTDLDEYRRCCRKGRGAILMTIARGTFSEGIHFAQEDARLVLIMGPPFKPMPKTTITGKGRAWNAMDQMYIEAAHCVQQCIGRAIRTRTDYAAMIFAGVRFENCFPWMSSWLSRIKMNVVRHSSEIEKELNYFWKQMAQRTHWKRRQRSLQLQQQKAQKLLNPPKKNDN